MTEASKRLLAEAIENENTSELERLQLEMFLALDRTQLLRDIRANLAQLEK